MSSLWSDLAEHAGQLSLSVLFMALLTFVLYGETHISKHARALFDFFFSHGWH